MSSSSSPFSEDDKKVVRWGIIGLGDVCQVKSGPPFWKCDGSRLVAVMRRTPGRAAAFARDVVPPADDYEHDGCVGYESLDAFLRHPGGLDAVYVCTRPGTHLEICERVARAGVPVCYVEKPAGRCAEETEQMAHLFASSSEGEGGLYTAYISRAYDKTQAIRTLLSEGAVGDRVTHVSYRAVGQVGARDMDGDDFVLPWRLDAAQSGGGLIMDVGCHVLDRIDYLCQGPLINVEGRAENRHSSKQQQQRVLVQVEDYVQLRAEIGGHGPHKGARVDCTWDFSSDEEPTYDQLVFLGPKGSLRMKGGPADPLQVYDPQGNMVREITFDMPEHTGQALIQAVTNDIRGVGDKKDYLSHGENAIRTQKVIDAALSSYYGGREPGFWDRMDKWPGSPSNKSKT